MISLVVRNIGYYRNYFMMVEIGRYWRQKKIFDGCCLEDNLRERGCKLW